MYGSIQLYKQDQKFRHIISNIDEPTEELSKFFNIVFNELNGDNVHDIKNYFELNIFFLNYKYNKI